MNGLMNYHQLEISGIIDHTFTFNMITTFTFSCSVNKRDSRGVFLYVVAKYSDDFHVFFSSDAQCQRLIYTYDQEHP